LEALVESQAKTRDERVEAETEAEAETLKTLRNDRFPSPDAVLSLETITRLRSEVSRLERALVEKSKKMETTMRAAETLTETSSQKKSSADAAAEGKTFFARLMTVMKTGVDFGRAARETGTAKAFARRLRSILETLDEPDASDSVEALGMESTPGPALTKETLDAAFEVWGALDAAKEELSILKGVESALSETKEKLRNSEAAFSKLRDELNTLETARLEAKASLADAVDASEAMQTRLVELEREAAEATASNATRSVETERLRTELVVVSAKTKRAAEAAAAAESRLEKARSEAVVEQRALREASEAAAKRSALDLETARLEIANAVQEKKRAESQLKALFELKANAEVECAAFRKRAEDAERRAAASASSSTKAAAERASLELKLKADAAKTAEGFAADLAEAKASLASALESKRKTESESKALRRALESAETRASVAEANAKKATESALARPSAATLEGELALARADLGETRAAFEIMRAASEDARAAEETLQRRVAELETDLKNATLLAKGKEEPVANRAAGTDRTVDLLVSGGGSSRRSGSSYYEIVDGQKYDRKVLDACRSAMADGTIDLAEARRIIANVVDGPRRVQKRGVRSPVTDIELATLRYARATFAWTPEAEKWVYDEVWGKLEVDGDIQSERKSLETLVGETEDSFLEATEASDLAETRAAAAVAGEDVETKRRAFLESEAVKALAEADDAKRLLAEAEAEVVSLRAKLKDARGEVSSSVPGTASLGTLEGSEVVRRADASVEALRVAFERRGEALERRVRLVFDAEAGAAKRWADALYVNERIIAEKDEEVKLYARRCEILESQLKTATAAKSAAESFASVRVNRTVEERTRTLRAEIVRLKLEIEETRVSKLRTSKTTDGGSHEKRSARLEADAAKALASSARDVAVSKAESAKLSAEKAALAVKARRAATEAEKARAKVTALETKLSDAEVSFATERREVQSKLRDAETALAAAKAEAATVSRLRDETARVLMSGATVASLKNEAALAESARLEAVQGFQAAAEALESTRVALKDAERAKSISEAETERVSGLLKSALNRVEVLEAEARLFEMSAENAVEAAALAKAEKSRAEEETRRLRSESEALEREVLLRDELLAARVAELDAASVELEEVRFELESRKVALAAAEQSRDDARRALAATATATATGTATGTGTGTGTVSETVRVVESGPKKNSKAKSNSNSKVNSNSNSTKKRNGSEKKACRVGTAGWAAENAGFPFAAADPVTEALLSSQSEVEERLRAARETWAERERDLRRRVRQLEAAAEAFDFAGASRASKRVNESVNGVNGPSRESLRILAEEAEKALRKRELELEEARNLQKKAKLEAAEVVSALEREASEARRLCEAAQLEAARLDAERKAEAAVWAQLENALREQIAAYERKAEAEAAAEAKAVSKSAVSEATRETDSPEDASNPDSNPTDDRVAWMRGAYSKDPGAGYTRETGDVAFLRAEVERLTAALQTRSEALEKVRSERLDGLERFGNESRTLSNANDYVSATSSSGTLPNVAEVEKAALAARGEAASLRARLEAKEAELADRATREKALAAAETALRARVADLSSELRESSRGYDAELARVRDELASLQSALTARETSVEQMQSRIDADVRRETTKRNAEISDAREALSKMQASLETMARDVERKKTIESSLRAAKADAVGDEVSQSRIAELEAECARLVARVEDQSRALERAKRDTDLARSRLEEASTAVGVPPREIWVQEEEEAEASRNVSVFDSAAFGSFDVGKVTLVASRLKTRVESRRLDLERARRKGAVALADRVAAEVAELETYLSTVETLQRRDDSRDADAAAAKSETLETSRRAAEEKARLEKRLMDVEDALSEARADAASAEKLRAENASLAEALLQKTREIEAETEVWESARTDLERALETERLARALEHETMKEEAYDLEKALEAARAEIDSLESVAVAERDRFESTLRGARRDLEETRDAHREAVSKLEAAETAATRASETAAAASEEVQNALRERLAESESRNARRLDSFQKRENELRATLDRVLAEALAKETELETTKKTFETLEAAASRATAEAVSARAEAVSKTAALRAALLERDASRRETVSLANALEARESAMAVSESRYEKASREAVSASRDVASTRETLRRVEAAFAEATLRADADAAAAKEAREAASSFEAQLRDAERRRDEASAAYVEERDALRAETVRLETALREAKAEARRTAVDAERVVDAATLEAEARVARLKDAAADIAARVRADAETNPETLLAASEAHAERAESLASRLAEAESAAEALEKHVARRVEEMQARVRQLELELAKKRDDKETKRLREEVLALERERVARVGVLETQVADLMAALRDARRDSNSKSKSKSNSKGSSRTPSGKKNPSKGSKKGRSSQESSSQETELELELEPEPEPELEPELEAALEMERALRATISDLEVRVAEAEKVAAAKTAAFVEASGSESLRSLAEAKAFTDSEITKLETRLAEMTVASDRNREQHSVELRVAAKARDAAVSTSRALERRLAKTNAQLRDATEEVRARTSELSTLESSLAKTAKALEDSTEARAAQSERVAALETKLEAATVGLRAAELAAAAFLKEKEELREQLTDEQLTDEQLRDEQLRDEGKRARIVPTEPDVSGDAADSALDAEPASRVDFAKLESAFAETREMYEVSIASLVSEKKALKARLEEALRDAASEKTVREFASEKTSQFSSERLAAMAERAEKAEALAEAYKKDLETARRAAKAVETETAADFERLNALVLDLERRAERERGIAAETSARLEAAESLLVSETSRVAAADSGGTEPAKEIADLREKLVDLESSYGNAVRALRAVERDLRNELAASRIAASGNSTLEATRAALEARVADAEATLEAERSRAAAEASAASQRAAEDVASLEKQLDALRATLASRDAALAEAETAAKALRAVNEDLGRRLRATETAKTADAERVIKEEVSRLRRDVEAARAALAERTAALTRAVAETELANERAAEAEAEAERVREKLAALEEIAGAADDADADGTERTFLSYRVRASLEGRIVELTRTSEARAEEIKKLAARKVELEGQVRDRRDAETLRAVSEKEAESLRSEMKVLTERATDLEKELEQRDALKAQLEA